MTLELPWPPSNNHYKHPRRGGGYYLTDKARAYHNEVFYIVRCKKREENLDTARLSVTVKAYPPDRRKRDLDNIWKVLLDSLQASDVFKDDSQIDHLEIRRAAPVKGGKILITIREIKCSSRKEA